MVADVTAAAAGDEVHGYILSPPQVARAWHWDRTCWPSDGISHTALTAPNVHELIRAQSRAGRFPCRRCATGVVLDDVAARADQAGYHYVACDRTPPSDDDLACGVCATLDLYAHTRGVLHAVFNQRTALLFPGCPPAGWEYGAMLNRMRLESGRTTEKRLPAVTAEHWGSAAALIYGGAPLGQALIAALALHAPAGGVGPTEAHRIEATPRLDAVGPPRETLPQ